MAYIPLPTPPLDFLTGTSFSPHDDNLLVTSYDGSVLLYSCQTPEGQVVPKLLSRFLADSPVLSLAFTSTRATFTGLLDGTIRQVDYENMKLSTSLNGTPTDQLSAAVNNLCTVQDHHNLLVASRLGGDLVYLDPRSLRVLHNLKSSSKIFAMDTTSTRVTVSQSSRQVQIYDVRKWDAPCVTRNSGLKYQITHLQNFPSQEGYALSSLDGRVSVEYYDELPEAQLLRFAFKCHRHRDKATGVDSVYPVNVLRFHARTNVLYTGGADGNVCTWDWQRRKRTKQFAAVDDSRAVSHMDINHDGSILVVGANDDLYLRAKDYYSHMETKGSKVYLKTLGND